MTLSSQLRTFLSLASEPSTGPAADELVRLAEEYREEERKREQRDERWLRSIREAGL